MFLKLSGVSAAGVGEGAGVGVGIAAGVVGATIGTGGVAGGAVGAQALTMAIIKQTQQIFNQLMIPLASLTDLRPLKFPEPDL
jgi:hypothetical protein